MNDSDSAPSPTIDMLYVDHHAWLQAWLGRRLGNAADAADLAHDTFLRLIDKPRRFDSAPAARSYLRSMANGLCVDRWRRHRIEQAWLDVLAAQPETLAPSAEHQVIVLEALYEIDSMLRSLPPKAAQAFMMAVGCSMTYREIAQELCVSVRMVAKYIAKATLACLRLEARQVVEELPYGGLERSAAMPAPAVS